MTLSVFPDVNVWVALNYEPHEHHELSMAWFHSLDEYSVLNFCRQTQLGFFRALTNAVILGDDVYSQVECWHLYEEWMTSGRAKMVAEPYNLEILFKARTQSEESSTKEWADAYLAAFAEAARLQIVTFDKALAGKSRGAILLG